MQTDQEHGAHTGMNGFDSSLGRLDAVTLEITLRKYRAWLVDAPESAVKTYQIGYAINGTWLGPVDVPLTGSGVAASIYSGTSNGRDYGYFSVEASGRRTASLDPANFIDRPRVFFDGYDPGRIDSDIRDTAFTFTGDLNLQLFEFGCRGPTPQGDDFCGETSYVLTYDYTTAADLAVPEPATWATMISGFGLIGASLRRRRTGRSCAI